MFVFTLSAVCAPAIAQKGGSKSGTLSEKSYARAREVLEAGLRALGGVEAIRAAEDVSVKMSGQGFARNQSVSIEGAYDRARHDESLYIDVRNRRYVVETRDELPGGFVFGGRTVVNGNQGFFVNPRDRTVTPVNMANFNNIGIIRRVPHVMLLAAYETGAATLRYLGEDTFDGRAHHVITAAATNGTQWSLYFDAKTNLLSKYELVVSDPLAGDAVREWVFPGYRTVGSLKVPTGRVTRQAGEVVEEVTYDDVQFNTRLPESAFAKPEGHEELPQPVPAATRETKLAEGVYLFESGANSLVVEFDTYVLVVEPYAGGRGAKAVITKAKEMFPAKPVKYVVVTHFHDDHSGGLRPYVAEGSSIVTTAANRQFFERMAAGTFTVARDDQTTARKKPAFEFVEKGSASSPTASRRSRSSTSAPARTRARCSSSTCRRRSSSSRATSSTSPTAAGGCPRPSTTRPSTSSTRSAASTSTCSASPPSTAPRPPSKTCAPPSIRSARRNKEVMRTED